MPNIYTDIVKEYLVKFPSVGSKRIASIIMQDIPGLFKNQEKARDVIRYYRGAKGVQNRDKISDDSFIPKVIIPESDHVIFEPYVLPVDSYPVIMAGDHHIPYHDQDAIELMIERAIEIKAKTLILVGDFMDCYQLSRFQKDPRKRSFKEEIAMAGEILDYIKQSLPDTKLIYKIGNHEERLDNYIMTNAPALYGIESLTYESLLRLQQRGIEVVKDKRIIRAKHLNVIHGHEYVYSITNPVNPARGLFNRAKKSAACFHHHRTSEHTETAINGDIISTWSGGCMCGLNPEYMPLNNWNLGFIELYDEDNFYIVRNRKIVNYRIL